MTPKATTRLGTLRPNSTIRISISSIQPPMKPDISPIVIPKLAANKIITTTALIVVCAPAIVLLNMSRPK